MHHEHHEACGCGCHHTHEEGAHAHVHDENCGCGHHHAPLAAEGSGLTSQQADILLAIHQRGYLPIARFVLRSTRDQDAYAVAMEPIYLAGPADDIDTVRENGELFASLEDMDLITLDYDLPLKGYAYEEYHHSSLYAYFVETVKEASQKPDFIMDVPVLELGSMALTEEGQKALDAMLKE